jgi:hypothetical protein
MPNGHASYYCANFFTQIQLGMHIFILEIDESDLNAYNIYLYCS